MNNEQTPAGFVHCSLLIVHWAVMPLPFRPNCQPTNLGPLPHTQPARAWEAVMHTTPQLPALPLLAAEGETPFALAAESFTGATLIDGAAMVDRYAAARGLDAAYAQYLRGVALPPSSELAAMPRLLPSEQMMFRRSTALFGLVLGPVSMALSLVDEQLVPVLDDAELLDACAKHVFLRRRWLRTMLERMGKPAILWVYEPYMAAATSPFCPLPADVLLDAVDQALGTETTRALWLPDVRCCMALQGIRLDLLGLALPHAESAAAEAAALAPVLSRLLAERTTVGWGIVPVTAEGLNAATVGRLAARFEIWLAALEAVGIERATVLRHTLVMPEDTLAYVDPPAAEHALSLTGEAGVVDPAVVWS